MADDDWDWPVRPKRARAEKGEQRPLTMDVAPAAAAGASTLGHSSDASMAGDDDEALSSAATKESLAMLLADMEKTTLAAGEHVRTLTEARSALEASEEVVGHIDEASHEQC